MDVNLLVLALASHLRTRTCDGVLVLLNKRRTLQRNYGVPFELISNLIALSGEVSPGCRVVWLQP